METIEESTLQARLKTWRRHLHQYPETGFEEVNTSDYVARILTTLGLDVHRGIGGTGLVANLTAGTGKRAIGIRADMDALPMPELTGLPWASTVPGKMHACGHDIHTVTLLGAAEVIKGLAPQLRGRVALVFQPAEELLSGAAAMIADGALEGLDASMAIGFHNSPSMEPGTFGWVKGACQAGSAAFDIVLHGRSGHAAHPYAAVDPIVAAAQLVTQLQTLVSRELNPLRAAVVTVGQLHAGTVRNIIPDQAKLSGTVRTFETATQSAIEDGMRRLLAGMEAGLRVKPELVFTPQVPPLSTDAAVSARVNAAIAAQFGEAAVKEGAASLGAEDFAEFAVRMPAAHVRIGSKTPGRSDALHNSDYQPDERAIGFGIQAISRAALEILS